MSAQDGDNKENAETGVIVAETGAPVSADDKGEKTPKAKPSKTKSGRGLAALALLIGLAGLALAGWVYYQLIYLNAQKAQAASAEAAQITELVGELESAQSETSAALAMQRARVAELEAALSQQQAVGQRQYQQITDRLQTLSTVDRDDWLLAEAEYLLRLANQRLQLSGDNRAAAKLLASADDILRSMDEPALHPVRAALAKEQAALRSSADYDLEGAYLKLQGIADSAASLEVYEAPSYEPEPVPVSEEGDWQENLKNGFERAWGKLRSYIRVRQHDANFQANLAPEQAEAVRASLRMMIEQAQLALLAERPALYRRSLEKAAKFLREYYPLNDRRGAVLAQLEPLIDAPVKAERPDLSGSLAELKEFIKARRWQREVGQ